MKFSIFVICLLLEDTLGKDLPKYIEKCSITTPSISNCIVEKANLAIHQLSKGDPSLGIPSVSPLHLPKALLEADNLQIFAEHVYVNGLQNMRVIDGLYDLASKRLGFSSTIDLLTVTGRYSITDSKILMYYVSGTGKFNITAVGCRMEYRGNIRLYEDHGETYMQIYGSTLDMRTDRSYYFFENLKSTDTGEDMNEMIDKNWYVLRSELLPSLKEHLLKLLRHYFAIPDRVPINRIFLP